MKNKKATRLPALVIATALGLSTTSYAENYDVTVATDNGTGDTANTLSWAIRQTNVNAGADIITLKTDVTITGVMKTLIDGAPSGGDHDSGGGDLFLESDSTRRSISGGDQFRPLFVKSGTVTIQNLDLENGKAKGGDSNYGGGGAGLGGALFVYSGSVTVENVVFSSNNASGGSGEISGFDDGGGGMFGNGDGNGGGGLFGDSTSNNGGYGGNGNYGGFGGSEASNGGFGGGGGYGYNGGGLGGFGGGGGYGDEGRGGNGGFGGGGGYGGFGGGYGGFGGGGGGGGYLGDYSLAGYGGGNGGGGAYDGGDYGGGAGFGGAIFAMNGTVTLIDVSFSGNTVTPGTGTNDGSAKAKDVFICTSALHATAALCGATVNACGTTSTSEIVGIFGNDCSGMTAPKMDITGNSISIADNDITPNTSDHTDFGSISAGSSITRTYTIINSGYADLNLTGSGDLVMLVGEGCTEFTVTAQPTSPVSSGGGTTTFTVQYSPADFGEDTCTITIDNDDSDKNPYNFSIKGTGRRGNNWLPAIYMLLL